MDHILTYGMSPVHITPPCSVGIVLVKEVIFSVVIYHAIGIVHPTIGGRKVVIGAISLLVVVVKSI